MIFPIGIQSFKYIRENGFVYVDKTDLVYKMISEGKVYFLSRPRRFGKSLLVDTLECYFSGGKELFTGLAIEKLEKNWYKHPIFKVDFNLGNFSEEGALEATIESFLRKWEGKYGKDITDLTLSTRFLGVIKRACEKTGRSAVVLVDEYDKPILDVLGTNLKDRETHGSLQDSNRELLRSFYSTLKSADKYLKFVLLTGVTKFSQVSVFSGFNQPKDISMVKAYESICGITQDEIEKYFREPVAQMAGQYGLTFSQMMERLKLQYDGYHFGSRMVDVYNPFSLLSALDAQEINDYWFATGSPSYLIRLMKHCSVQIDDMLGRTYPMSEFMDYKADVERPVPMLFQSGYLTIRSYDGRSGKYRLDFPNREVRGGFLSLLANNYFGSEKELPQSWATDAAILLEDGKLEEFRTRMVSFLAGIPYDAHESLKKAGATEKHFQYTFYLILRLIESQHCVSKIEERQNIGRVDCIFETLKYIYIFEFKLNGTAESALKQIEDNGYAVPYSADNRKIIKIGVNFSGETMNIDEWKVAY